MPKQKRPWPYNFELDGAPYLYPPSEVMAALNSSAFVRDSTEWFPPRQQQANVSEAIFPPDAETGTTVLDRSGGYGWTDVRRAGEADAPDNVYAYTDSVDLGTTGEGQGVDCSVEGVAFLGPRVLPAVLPQGVGELAAHWEMTVAATGVRRLHVMMGTRIFRTTDGDTWTLINSDIFPSLLPLPTSPPTGRVAVFQGASPVPRAYIPFGKDAPYRAFTVDSDASSLPGAFEMDQDGVDISPFVGGTRDDLDDVTCWIDCVVVDDLLYVLWYDRTTNKYRVSSTADGLTDYINNQPTYSPSIAVSDASDEARFLLYAHDTLYIGCDRSLRTLDAERTTLHEVLWTTTAPGENNFRWWTQWRDELWFTADQGEYRITADRRFQPIGPETLTGNRTPVRGVVRAKAGDDYCLYQFLRNEDGLTYLVKFREYDQGRRWAHHPILRVGTYDVNYAFVSTIDGASPRLYFGVSTTEIRYFKLPRNGVYPPADPLCEFAEKGQVFDTRMSGQLYFVNKSLFAHTTRAEQLSATELVTPFYRTDQQPTFVQFGTEALDTDPGERIELAEPALCAWWEGRTRLERSTSDTFATPIVLATTWNFVYRPVAKGGYTVYVYAQDDLKNRAGGRDRRTAADYIVALEALDSSQTPKFFVDPWGVRRQVFVNRVRCVDFTRDADQWPTGVVMLTLVEFRGAAGATWDDLEGLTWDEAESFTYDQLEVLNP